MHADAGRGALSDPVAPAPEGARPPRAVTMRLRAKRLAVRVSTATRPLHPGPQPCGLHSHPLPPPLPTHAEPPPGGCAPAAVSAGAARAPACGLDLHDMTALSSGSRAARPPYAALSPTTQNISRAGSPPSLLARRLLPSSVWWPTRGSLPLASAPTALAKDVHGAQRSSYTTSGVAPRRSTRPARHAPISALRDALPWRGAPALRSARVAGRGQVYIAPFLRRRILAAGAAAAAAATATAAATAGAAAAGAAAAAGSRSRRPAVLPGRMGPDCGPCKGAVVSGRRGGRRARVLVHCNGL